MNIKKLLFTVLFFTFALGAVLETDRLSAAEQAPARTSWLNRNGALLSGSLAIGSLVSYLYFSNELEALKEDKEANADIKPGDLRRKKFYKKLSLVGLITSVGLFGVGNILGMINSCRYTTEVTETIEIRRLNPVVGNHEH